MEMQTGQIYAANGSSVKHVILVSFLKTLMEGMIKIMSGHTSLNALAMILFNNVRLNLRLWMDLSCLRLKSLIMWQNYSFKPGKSPPSCSHYLKAQV